MCHRCAWLERRVENLEGKVLWLGDELGYANAATDGHDLELAMGLKPTEARILLRLHKAAKVLSRKQLAEELDHGPECLVDEDQVVDVVVHRLRKALPFDSINTVWGRGYRLTPAGHALVGGALTRLRAA